jgi:hypothetical protein
MGSSPNRPKKARSLGPHIKTYRDRPLTWRDLIFTFAPASLAVLTPLFYGIQRAQYARSNYGPVAAQAWSKPWFLLSAVALIPLLLLGLRRLRRSHRAIMVYKNGLSIQGIGRKNRKIGWGGISGIVSHETLNRFLGIPIKKSCRVTLHPRIGKPVKLDPHIPDLDELSARIKAKLYPRLTPVLKASLKSGSTIIFGPIHMDHERISVHGKIYQWDQISGIQVLKGVLRISFDDQRDLRIAVRDIPNIEIFIQMIQEGLIA